MGSCLFPGAWIGLLEPSQFSTNNYLLKFLIKIDRFRPYLTKAEIKWVFPTPGGDAFVQNSLFYKIETNILAKFFIKVHRFLLIHQKLYKKDFSRLLVELHLFRIQLPTIYFLAKLIIQTHSFGLIYQILNSKGFFWSLVVTHSFRIQFSTNNYLTNFLIEMNRFQRFQQKLNSHVSFRLLVAFVAIACICSKFNFLQNSNKYPCKISYKSA